MPVVVARVPGQGSYPTDLHVEYVGLSQWRRQVDLGPRQNSTGFHTGAPVQLGPFERLDEYVTLQGPSYNDICSTCQIIGGCDWRTASKQGD